MPQSQEYRICSRGVWDTTVPGITFDETGACNYAKLHDILVNAYPRGEIGLAEWQRIVKNVKSKGNNKRYDCIIGVSGGTDSSYLCHIAREYGLRPLAVNLDNGWSSDIAVKNIRKITSQLDIDLETYVIDYEEIKNLMRSYMMASLPWIDIPTDIAIKASLYQIAARESIKFIFRGNDFRTEGTQPNEWTVGDGKQLKYIHKKFGTVQLKTFPNQTMFDLFYYGYFKRIKSIYPFYFLDYQKKAAQAFLKKNYDWEYYGGHHHENIFTKFTIAYWLPKKFNIDKRKITLSAQVLSGEITREEALEQLKHPPYNPIQMERDKEFTIKKLGLNAEDFNEIFNRPNKSFIDYPSYFFLMQKFMKLSNTVLKYMLPYKPMALYQMELRELK
jgi:N-acetyl sugar amidotransferase